VARGGPQKRRFFVLCGLSLLLFFVLLHEVGPDRPAWVSTTPEITHSIGLLEHLNLTKPKPLLDSILERRSAGRSEERTYTALLSVLSAAPLALERRVLLRTKAAPLRRRAERSRALHAACAPKQRGRSGAPRLLRVAVGVDALRMLLERRMLLGCS
jgi:hypothetical protein